MAHATLQDARKAFTEELRVTAHVTDERVLEAFAAVPRKRFAGPGPWRRLRRDAHEQDETCWLHRDGWCLSKRALH